VHPSRWIGYTSRIGAGQRDRRPLPSLQSLFNALFHLAAWIAPGDYAPGAVTGAVVSIPATGYFFAWVRRQARATAAELILAVAVGTVVAAVAIGFLSCP
jgi:hypothetical protein